MGQSPLCSVKLRAPALRADPTGIALWPAPIGESPEECALILRGWDRLATMAAGSTASARPHPLAQGPPGRGGRNQPRPEKVGNG